MPRFSVFVPFEPVPQEDLRSRVINELPDTDLPHGIILRRSETEYSTELEISTDDPYTAKLEAIRLVEDFLAVLAAWNCAFQVRIAGVRSQVVERSHDVVFIESHVEAIARRGDLTTETALFERQGELSEHVRSCLELNYLLVLSSRPANRWLLAATGLEALAVGAMGAQPTVSKMLTTRERGTFRPDLQSVLSEAGLGEVSDRIIDRVFGTTQNRVADHMHAFLASVGINDLPSDVIAEWWRKRSKIAHGEAVDLDPDSLRWLIDVFQRALRRAAGAEAIS